MKVIIPVAGAGLRLRPHTYTQPKPLIPVAGKAILATIIDRLVLEPQIDTIVLVIGYLGDKIQSFIQQQYPQLNIQFVYQENRLGLGHAVWTARHAFQDDEEVLIVLGDIIFDGNLSNIITAPISCLGVKKVEDPREFGVVELHEDQSVRRLVEKPRIPKSNLALVGLYKICQPQQLVHAIAHLIERDIRTRDEYQLTDALMYMHEQGTPFMVEHFDTWFDCGRKENLLETNALLLRTRHYQQPQADGAHANNIIIPPVSIGKDCKIQHSVIGPNVSIGDNATLTRAIIRNSIIGNFATLEETVLNRSIIGNDTTIKGKSQILNIGDNTEIDFN